MKKSEFKALIKEAMLEILPEIMKVMVENVNENYNPQSVQQKPDLTLIRQHISQATETGQKYDGIGVQPVSPRNQAPNPREVLDGGETYASGKGIMEWFGSQAGKVKPQSEFNHSADQMDEFMAKKFGVK